MPFLCSGCKRSFKEQRGRTNHKRHCKALREQGDGLQEAEGLSGSGSRARKRARHSNPSPNPCLGARVNKDASTVIDRDIAPEIDSYSEVPPAPESPPASISFSGRRRKVPQALKDYIPHSLVGLPSHLHPAPPRPEPVPRAESVIPGPVSTPGEPDPGPEPDLELTTEANGFGLYRIYARKP